MELSAPFHKRRSVPLLFALIIFLVCTVYLAYNTSVPTRVRIPDQHHMIGPNTENPATATAMIIQRERIKNVNALRHDDKHIWDLNTLGIGNPKMVNMELFGIDHLEKRKENEVNENPIETEERKKCYRYAEDDKSNAAIKLFDDVLLSNRHPRIDKTMFFIVTTCFADQLAQLNPRQVQQISPFNGQSKFGYCFAGKRVPSNRRLHEIQVWTYLCYLRLRPALPKTQRFTRRW